VGSGDVCDIVYRRSTESGKSWAPLQLLTGNNTRSTPSIDWYTTVFDAKTQRLFIFVRAGTGLGTQGYVSTDLGESFTGPTPLVLQGGSQSFKQVTPSMGHGLQLASGRLVVPFVCGAPEPVPAVSSRTHSCTLLSDTNGQWYLGGLAQNGTAETALSLVPGTAAEEVIFASMRDRGPAARDSLRLTARSSDGGDTWGDFRKVAALKAPCTEHWCSGVVAGLALLNGSAAGSGGAGSDAPPLLAYSSPSAPATRAVLRFFLSSDEGQHWSSGPGACRFSFAYGESLLTKSVWAQCSGRSWPATVISCPWMAVRLSGCYSRTARRVMG
jgi:hypothetical protein